MGTYLDNLIEALEGEAEEQCGHVKHLQGMNARRGMSSQHGLLNRILQRLETLRRLQASERAKLQSPSKSADDLGPKRRKRSATAPTSRRDEAA